MKSKINKYLGIILLGPLITFFVYLIFFEVSWLLVGFLFAFTIISALTSFLINLFIQKYKVIISFVSVEILVGIWAFSNPRGISTLHLWMLISIPIAYAASYGTTRLFEMRQNKKKLGGRKK